MDSLTTTYRIVLFDKMSIDDNILDLRKLEHDDISDKQRLDNLWMGMATDPNPE